MALKIAKNLTSGLQGQEAAARSYLVKDNDPLVQSVLDGRYRVLSRIGEGNMSTVYKGRHELTGRIVAIKVLRREFCRDQASTKRFHREVKAISTLSHPYLIAVHDVGMTPAGQPYQVIEYLQGRSLADIIEHEGRLEPRRAARVVSHICDAMDHAHSKGVIHRDLKPENVMLTNFGGKPDFVKVVDFGIVKLTHESQVISQRLTATGEVWGSPLYASPEQCLGHDLDKRSDVYSLGLILYEALTGKPAVSGKNIGQIAIQHVRERPASFDAACPGHAIPARLEEVVFKALEKEPARRFQTMAEMRDALELLFPGIGTVRAEGAAADSISVEQNRESPPAPDNRARPAAIVSTPADQAGVADQRMHAGAPDSAHGSSSSIRSAGSDRPALSLQSILIIAVVVLALALVAVLAVAVLKH